MNSSSISSNRRIARVSLLALVVFAVLSVPVPAEAIGSRNLAVLPESERLNDCATAEYLALRRISQNFPAASVADRPSLSDQQKWTPPDGLLALHYSIGRNSSDAVPLADRNHNGTPDYIESVALGFSEAVSWAERAGFVLNSSRGNRIDLYFQNLNGRARGFMVPLPRPQRGADYLVIDSRLGGDEAFLRSVGAHQAAHAILAAYDPDGPPWWQESSAAAIEIESQHSAAPQLDRIAALLMRPERGIFAEGTESGTASILWTIYLIESSSSGPGVFRQIWEDAAAAAPSDNAALLEIMDRSLRAQGTSLGSAFAEFTTWNLFTGSRDDGVHYSFGSTLPDPYLADSHQTYPAIAISAERAIEPLGWSLVRFEPDGHGGGIAITFEGDESGSWQADLLIASRQSPKSYKRVSVSTGAAGRGTVSIPWDDTNEILLLVRNANLSGPAGNYSYVVRSDPAFPYELASLSAVSEGGPDHRFVRLNWETESESRLYGWHVYRSAGHGQFVRATDIAIPAIGGESSEDGAVSYQFIDSNVRSGLPYQYYVVGTTVDGLSQRSFVVTTRVPR